MEMIDYTDMLIAGGGVDGTFPLPPEDTEITDPFEGSTRITLNMLKKRPDILKALEEPLADMIIPWEDEEEEEPEDWITNQLVNAVNLEPFIQTTIFECLNGMGDVSELEGDEMYFPSVFSMESATELERQTELGGFSEDHEGVPAKYVHLSQKHQDMIYTHPEARIFLSSMPMDSITEEFVEQLCKDQE
jgi:hypothetical protein